MAHSKRDQVMRRAYQRFPTSFDAWVARLGAYLPVHVSDISVRGAKIRMIQDRPGLRIGERVVLRANGTEVPAQVVRQGSDHYGLYFQEDIAPLQMVRENYAPLRRCQRAHGQALATGH